jgi:hypothetical protein
MRGLGLSVVSLLAIVCFLREFQIQSSAYEAARNGRVVPSPRTMMLELDGGFPKSKHAGLGALIIISN